MSSKKTNEKCGAGKVRSRSTGKCRSKKKPGRKASFSPQHHHHRHHFSPMKLRSSKKKTPAKHSRSMTKSYNKGFVDGESVGESVSDAEFDEWVRQGIKDGIFRNDSYRDMDLPPGNDDPNIRYWRDLP